MSFSKSKPSPNRTKNARILVIDDNADHLILIKKAIQQSFNGVNAILVDSEPAAIQHLDECEQTGLQLPQLVLLDLYLPERENGWHFLKTIKNRSAEIGLIPVVIFSHSSFQEDIAGSYDRGVSSYVTKPSDFTEWVNYFQMLNEYWWQTVSLPNRQSMY